VPRSSASSPEDSPSPDAGGDQSDKGSVFDRMFRGRKKK